MTSDNDNQTPEYLNLRDPSLRNLAGAYFIENSQREGEDNKEAVDMLYRATLLQVGYPSKVLEDLSPEELQTILGTRQEGQRYTEAVPVLLMMRKAKDIYLHSLGESLVDDLVEGTGIELDEQYKGKKLKDLPEADQAEITNYHLGSFRDEQVIKGRTLMKQSRDSRLVDKLRKPEEPRE
jgi:hypothetical protein